MELNKNLDEYVNSFVYEKLKYEEDRHNSEYEMNKNNENR